MGGVLSVACQGFLVREACVGVLVGGAGFLLSGVQWSDLFLKTMVCFSGCLMSSASLQKLFCEVCSALKCSFEEFVREKVVIPSYSSAIFTVPSLIPGFNSGCLAFRGSLLHGRSPMKQQGFCSVFQAQMTVIETEVQTGLVVKP